MSGWWGVGVIYCNWIRRVIGELEGGNEVHGGNREMGN